MTGCYGIRTNGSGAAICFLLLPAGSHLLNGDSSLLSALHNSFSVLGQQHGFLLLVAGLITQASSALVFMIVFCSAGHWGGEYTILGGRFQNIGSKPYLAMARTP